MNLRRVFAVASLMFTTTACSVSAADLDKAPDPAKDLSIAADAGPQEAVLAGGCFWCTEAVFEYVPGVIDVESGYAGDDQSNANYEAVSAGLTRHAEAIKITYDPAKTSYGKLLKAFFTLAHDPTTLNRQGPDRGPHYRSAIFYANDEQKAVAEAYIKQLDESKAFASPIVTTLEPLTGFYPAEKYHQDFVQKNPQQGYVQQQALPKVTKTKQAFGQ